MKKKYIVGLTFLVIIIAMFAFVNPFSYNDPTERTVVTGAGGKQFVKFEPGVFWSGFFAKEVSWPNQISVSYIDSIPNYDMVDNSVDIGRIIIRFNDATTASVSGIVQYILPSSDSAMLALHNAHRTPEALVKRRLSPYTKECLQSSGQSMSSEMHYSGGRAQMTQDYIDQLKNGAFLLMVKTNNTYDSLEKSSRKTYDVTIQYNKDGTAKRKFSSIKEYGLTVGDAQITDVDYEVKVDQMLAKKIDAATKSSISKQELMTAQQQALTAEAQGKKKLVEIEYVQKQRQTELVVAAQTQVELAKQDLEKQTIMLTAAGKEAAKIKVLADANAYEKAKLIQADGALAQKMETWLMSEKYKWDAFAKYQGNMVPLYIGGSNGSNMNAQDFFQAQGMKAMQDLNLNLKNK